MTLHAFDFELAGPPRPKARARVVMVKGRATSYTPKETRQYERALRMACAAAWPGNDWPMFGAFRVTVDAYFGDARVRDVDNLGKSVLDALNMLAYRDDSQVHELLLRKHIDREQPRTRVRVEAIE